MTALFLQGNALSVLGCLPADYFHCATTSPPYFGLRKYEGGDEVWDGDESCEHNWGEPMLNPCGRISDTHPGKLQSVATHNREVYTSNLCSKCGAVKYQLGAEKTPDDYLWHLIQIMREVRRVLRPDGVFWLNIGDSWSGSGGAHKPEHANSGLSKSSSRDGVPSGGLNYNGCKPLDMVLIPEQLALAARADGWYVRSILIWAKGVSCSDEYNGNPMPESVDGWKFTKHRVKIGQYEKMRRLWESKHPNQDWPFDLQGVSKSKTESVEAQVSGREQIPRNNEGVRATAGGQGKAQDAISFRVGQAQQGQVRSYEERQGNKTEGYQEILSESEGESQSENERREAEVQSIQGSFAQRVPQEVYTDREGQGDDSDAECPQTCLDDGYAEPSDGGAVATGSQGQPLSLPLLWHRRQDDVRPRDSVEQGRQAHDRQRGSGLPEMQQQEARQDSNDVIDCPGCPKCFSRNGLVLRKGSWRATDAFEYVLMLTKTSSYFCDREAVLEHSVYPAGESRAGGNGHKSLDAGSRTTEGLHNRDWNGNGGRNLRSVLMIPTAGSKIKHFAIFPPRLIEPLIKAATSEKGCCPKCGSPWARVIDKGEVPHDGNTDCKNLDAQGSTRRLALMRQAARERGEEYSNKSSTIGWLPTCQCQDTGDPIPCRILDPFSGAGTTALVAERLGLDSIGIDTSAEYIALSEARLAEDEQKRVDEQIKQLRREAKLAGKNG